MALMGVYRKKIFFCLTLQISLQPLHLEDLKEKKWPDGYVSLLSDAGKDRKWRQYS